MKSLFHLNTLPPADGKRLGDYAFVLDGEHLGLWVLDADRTWARKSDPVIDRELLEGDAE